MGHRILFIADPLEGLIPHHDTTVAMMRSAPLRGNEAWFCKQEWIRIEGGRPVALVHQIDPTPHEGMWFKKVGEARRPLSDFHMVHMRTDPPVDEAYLTTTRLLDLIEGGRTWVINRPAALRDFNEKLFTFQFPQWMPPTLITREASEIKSFIKAQSGKAVLKPLSLFGGQGIFGLTEGDPNLNSIIEVSTGRCQRPVMVQRYLPEVIEGDRRIFIVDGEPLGVLVRLPQPGDLRANMAAGGAPVAGKITEREREICNVIGKRLVQEGVYICGLDIIGGWVTEINITSPTGMQEIQRFDGKNWELHLIERFDNLYRTRYSP